MTVESLEVTPPSLCGSKALLTDEGLCRRTTGREAWELEDGSIISGYKWGACVGDDKSLSEHLSTFFHPSRFVLYDADRHPVAYYSSSWRFGVFGKLVCTAPVDAVLGAVVMSLIVGPLGRGCEPQSFAQLRYNLRLPQARKQYGWMWGSEAALRKFPKAEMWQQPAGMLSGTQQ